MYTKTLMYHGSIKYLFILINKNEKKHKKKKIGYTDIVTIGGIQSNHCRAVATAARLCSIDSHLILRNGDGDEKNKDPG